MFCHARATCVFIFQIIFSNDEKVSATLGHSVSPKDISEHTFDFCCECAGNGFVDLRLMKQFVLSLICPTFGLEIVVIEFTFGRRGFHC